MAKIDSPLKRLVKLLITDFAARLLEAEVQEAHTLTIELQAEPTQADPILDLRS